MRAPEVNGLHRPRAVGPVVRRGALGVAIIKTAAGLVAGDAAASAHDRKDALRIVALRDPTGVVHVICAAATLKAFQEEVKGAARTLCVQP